MNELTRPVLEQERQRRREAEFDRDCLRGEVQDIAEKNAAIKSDLFDLMAMLDKPGVVYTDAVNQLRRRWGDGQCEGK